MIALPPNTAPLYSRQRRPPRIVRPATVSRPVEWMESMDNAGSVRGAGQRIAREFDADPRRVRRPADRRGHRAAALRERLESVGASWSQVAAVVLTHTHWRSHRLGHLSEAARRRIVLPLPRGPSRRAGRRPRLPTAGAGRTGLLLRGGSPVLDGHRAATRADPPAARRRADVRVPDRGLRRAAGPAGEHRLPRRHRELVRAMAEVLADVDVLGVEFNHDVAMQKIVGTALGADPAQPRRPGPSVESTRGGAGQAVLERSRRGAMQHLVLLHLSQQCNRPALAIEAARVGRAGRGAARGRACRPAVPAPIPISGSGRDRPGRHRRSLPDRTSPPPIGCVPPAGRATPVLAGLFDEHGSRQRSSGGALTVAHYFASDVHLRDDHPERDTASGPGSAGSIRPTRW